MHRAISESLTTTLDVSLVVTSIDHSSVCLTGGGSGEVEVETKVMSRLETEEYFGAYLGHYAIRDVAMSRGQGDSLCKV